MKLVLASGNDGKLRELSSLLGPLGYELVAQSWLGIEPVPETGETFHENALIKARHAALRSGLPALADDSGIEVDALGGRPGVRSARYAGEKASDEQNLQKLLLELEDVAAEKRTARYQCVVAFIDDADPGSPVIAAGSWEGRILTAPRGTHGFGYDPVFLPVGSEQSAAELEPARKNAMSHRAEALRKLHGLLLCRP